MPRYELTIDANYLAGSWGAYQGVRELVQNARDAEVEFNAKMTITHYDKGDGQLRINNDGVTLGKEALLMGHTSKATRQDLIGKWGEGLKVGILALLRDNYTLKIRTGDEVWVPVIEHSEKFNADVLVFQVTTGHKYQNRVRIEISPFSREDWQEWRTKFLFLDKEDSNEKITCYQGSLLLNPAHKGMVFVKGIAAEQIQDLAYGYDLTCVELDRDRRMVDRWYLKYYTAQIWETALKTRPDLLDPFFAVMQSGSEEANGLAENLGEKGRALVAEKFTQVYGAKALPVNSVGDSARLEHHGKLGVIVPVPMKTLLEKVFGETKNAIEDLERKAQKQYGWHELSKEEKANLQRAVDLVAIEEPRLSLDLIQVTDFVDEGTRGMYEVVDGKVIISLAKKILTSPKLTLSVTIHEAAHMAGKDGDHSHIGRLEEIWGNIVQNLLDSTL